MNSNSECLFVEAPYIHYKDLAEHLKSNGTSFQGIVWTKWISKCKGARSAHHILLFWFLDFGVALYDETKVMCYSPKSPGIGHTNHRHIELLILQVWNVYLKNCSSYSRISYIFKTGSLHYGTLILKKFNPFTKSIWRMVNHAYKTGFAFGSSVAAQMLSKFEISNSVRREQVR